MTGIGSDWYTRAGKRISCSLVRDWPNVPVERAQGCYAYGPNGEKYLDFCSGMASANTGHCHPRVVAAIKEQSERLLHGPMGVLLYEPIVKLAEELATVTPAGLDSFFFLNSGSEAIEGAIKLARYVTERPAIVAFTGGFHGRTMGAASVTTSKSKYRRHYEPFMGSTYFVPYPYCFRCPLGLEPDRCGVKCFRLIHDLFDHCVQPSDVAAFIIEPILGEGGYTPAPPEYLAMLRKACDEQGIMLIFDEVQSGFGRTGTMFAAQGTGVTPDIMAIAKGIASGLPLGATVTSTALMSKWSTGAHGTTFGGNPVCCAAALATLEVFREEDLLNNVKERGNRALEYLKGLRDRYPSIGDVRGRGLMIGIEMVKPGTNREPDPTAAESVLKGCLKRGLILYPAGTYSQVIRFIPPLIVSEEDLELGLRILERAISEI